MSNLGSDLIDGTQAMLGLIQAINGKCDCKVCKYMQSALKTKNQASRTRILREAVRVGARENDNCMLCAQIKVAQNKVAASIHQRR